MSRLMRAAIGTNNIDNCSRVCHSPTSFALRKSLGLSGRDRLVRRHRRGRRGDHHRRQPDRGPPGRRRADQAGDDARHAARDDRPAPDRARRLRRAAPRPRPGTNAAVMLGLCHVVRRDGLVDRAFIDGRTEGYEALEELLDAYDPDAVEEITGVPAADLEAAAHIYAEAGERLDPLGSRRHRAPLRLGGRAADLQPRADDRQDRPRRVGAAAAARTEQRPGLLRHGRAARTPTPPTARSPTRRSRSSSRRRGACRSRARVGYKIPRDVRRRGRRRSEGDVDLRRGRRADRSEHRRTSSRRSSRSSSSSARTSSRPRRRKLRRRDPAGVGVPREDRHVHQRRATLPARRAGDRPARIGQDRLRDPHDDLARARPRDGLGDAERRDGRDRGADAGVRRRQPRADRPHGPAVAGRRRRHRLADPLREGVRAARRSRALRRAALQGARRRGRRRVPDHPHHGPAPPALQRRHDDAPHRQHRAASTATGSRSIRTTPRACGSQTGDKVSVRSRVGRIETIARVTDRIEPGHVFTAFHFPEVRTNLLIGALGGRQHRAAPSTRSSPSTSGPCRRPWRARPRSLRTSADGAHRPRPCSTTGCGTRSQSRSRSRSASTARRWRSRCARPGTTRSSRSASSTARA